MHPRQRLQHELVLYLLFERIFRCAQVHTDSLSRFPMHAEQLECQLQHEFVLRLQIECSDVPRSTIKAGMASCSMHAKQVQCA